MGGGSATGHAVPAGLGGQAGLDQERIDGCEVEGPSTEHRSPPTPRVYLSNTAITVLALAIVTRHLPSTSESQPSHLKLIPTATETVRVTTAVGCGIDPAMPPLKTAEAEVHAASHSHCIARGGGNIKVNGQVCQG